MWHIHGTRRDRSSPIFSTSNLIILYCRFKAESKVHDNIQAELQKTSETFKGFERKDIKLKEDMKHLKAKLKKLGDKLTKDTTKAEVRLSRNHIFLEWTTACEYFAGQRLLDKVMHSPRSRSRAFVSFIDS